MTRGYLEEMAQQGYHPEAIGSFHRTMIPYLARHLGIQRADLIVDIGAGQGHALIPLHAAGYSRLAAIDIDSLNFELFLRKYGIDCHLTDVAVAPLPFETASVDLALNFHLIEHLPSPSWFLEETFRILRPGGVICIVTPDWRKQYKTFYSDPTHLRPYDKDSMARLLRMHGFRNPELRSWGTAWGLGRLQVYRISPAVGFWGLDMLAIARKP